MKPRKTRPKLTHLNAKDLPAMVAVGNKPRTHRSAWSRGTLLLPLEVLQLFDGNDIRSKKGPVFQTAIIAGTMAIKKTSDLIPLCHAITIEGCDFDIRLEKNTVVVDCFVTYEGKTGVEMEALIGTNIAMLTIYDMCKAISQDMSITSCRLMAKEGGKHSFQRTEKSSSKS